MKKITKNIYEHLKTFKKYRTLKNAYDTVLNDLHDMTNERDAIQQANKVMKEVFNENVNKLVEENIELRFQIKELKKELKKIKTTI